MSRLRTTTDFVAAISGVDHIQESLPERLDIKRRYHKEGGQAKITYL
ncbi:hypothetical protein BPNPMPFG_006668 (plasmid) [Mesorhizobium sp. AR07]|nr:hypothetical protein BPNPMPFG_006668 [Mesorhizobium sp. AR07]